MIFMEIINKVHEKILSNVRVDLSDYLRVEEKVMYFSAGCNLHLGIISGLYMHFINDDDRWLFYLNSENDGFATIPHKGKNCTLVMNKSLSELFRKRTNTSINSKFPIRMTKAKQNDAPIYEIDLTKPF